ncbi:hypothetical protein PG997_006742 [Apiospora hydei]|uniref:Peptidase S1 domain-containing protein n=1 Tax=Apiospora hydei TaxID=1337664 RepID=A0ABR1WPL6_9PEZI
MQRLRRSETGKWPYAANSTGTYRGLLKQKYHCWFATGPARDLFTTEIFGKLNHMLGNTLPESNSHMTLTLFMIGKVPQKTNPTIMVVSDDKPRRKEAFEKAKASRILADYPGFELGHCDVAAEHEDLRQLGTWDIPPIDLKNDEQPEEVFACADTFGVPKWGLHKPTSVHFHDGLGRKTSSVTCSGLFSHDNSYYIITAAHVMTRSPQPPGPSYDMAFGEYGSDSDDCEITGLDDWDSDTDDEMLSSVTSHRSITSSSVGSDNEERLAGRKTTHQSPPSVTTVSEETFEQVPETFQSSATKGKGEAIHDLCVPLGPVLFIDGELDLALIRVPVKSLEHEESLKRLPSDREGSADSSATALTASKGPISGKQLSMPFYTRLPGVHDFRMMHPFHLDIPLSAGDSGSWVIGGDDQELIGFVVSGSPKTGLCLVCPAKGAIRTFSNRLHQRSVASAAGHASGPPLRGRSQKPGDDPANLQRQGSQQRPSTRSLMDELVDPPSSYREGEPRPVVSHRIVQHVSTRPLMPDTRDWRVASHQEPVGTLQRRRSASPPSRLFPPSYFSRTGESSQTPSSGRVPEESLNDYDWREAEAREVLGHDFPDLDLGHFDDEDAMDTD